MSKNRTGLFALVFTLILALSAFMTTPAFADDGPLPAESGEEAAPADANAGVEEQAPAVDEAAPPAPSDGTGLVVLNSDGESLPLASQEAEEVLSQGDPRWCPAGATPPSGCSPSFTSFDGLETWIYANPTLVGKAGVIWVEKTYDLTNDSDAFELDGAVLTLMKNFDLTIKGGWAGTGTTVDTATPSILDIPIRITNWIGNVTISDISIIGAAGPEALLIETAKNITLTRVEVSSSAGDGAKLSNKAAADAGTNTGNVIVTNGVFGSNTGSGLQVFSDGTVTVTSVVALNNGDDGVYIDNSTAKSPTAPNPYVAKLVTVNGTNFFSHNGGNGLKIISNGAVTLNAITANYNGEKGADVDNRLNYVSSGLTSAVSVIGVNNFYNNGKDGLYIKSAGKITTNNLTAINNGTGAVSGYGVYLDNASVIDTKPQPVLLNGVNVFNQNLQNGLQIYSKGAVSLYSVTANNNSNAGVQVDNNSGLSAVAQAVTFYLNNTFNNNTLSGLVVNSYGLITVSNVTANYNNADGVQLNNTGSTAATPPGVSISGVSEFTGNSISGLRIISMGKFTLKSITANYNGEYGALILNCVASGSDLCNGSSTGLGVTLSGTNNFNYNGYEGLRVHGLGLITIGGVSATYNTRDGVNISNMYGASTAGVTVNGVNNFSNNGKSGVYVRSYGTITLGNTTANNNGTEASAVNYFGADLSNQTATVARGVTLTGSNNFNFNDGGGLTINATGAVVSAGMTASYNTLGDSEGYGVSITNFYLPDTAPQDVTLNGVNRFEGNASYGLGIFTRGVVSVSNATANDNNSYGVYVDNVTSPANAVKSVSFKGKNVFNENNLDGLIIKSTGAIALNNVTAMDNVNNGVNLDNLLGAFGNSNALTPQNVTLTGVNTFSDNGADGLLVETYGTISTYTLVANNNGGYGVYLDNCQDNAGACDAGSPRNVTISLTSGTTSSFFNDNDENGLYVSSRGLITVKNLAASENTQDGVFLKNDYSNAIAGITINGSNLFSGNGGYGLHAVSHGSVLTYNLTATSNTSGGVYLTADADNTTSTTAYSNVTLNGNNTFNGNGDSGIGHGLVVLADGAITLNNITAGGNEQDGVNLDNDTPLRGSAVTPKSIVFNGINFLNDNGRYGLNFLSDGTVTLNRVNADLNISDGVYGSTTSTSASAITVFCSSLVLNSGYGLNLSSNGTTLLKSVFTFGNLNPQINITGSYTKTRAC